MSHISLIAERLRILRHRHALTQQEFADLAGIAFTFYQLLESGKKKQVWLETVAKLAGVYGLDVWEFLKPELPRETVINRKIPKSALHYNRRRKGPYYKAADISAKAKGNFASTTKAPAETRTRKRTR